MNGQIDIGGITPSRYFFSIAVVLGLLFAMTSGETAQPAWLVGLQWQLQSLIPMALLVGSHMLLLRNARFAALNPWIGLAFSGVVGASLFAPAALLIEVCLGNEPLEDVFATELRDEWLAVTPPVALCWVALNAPWQLGYRLEKAPGPGPGDAVTGKTEVTPAFVDLLPPERRGAILMLKSELHYLQVVTDRGNALILYNLGDAIDELPREAGMQVHRSYWVAWEAITEFGRRGRQGELRLHDGSRVPVSRNRMADLRERLETAAV